MREQSIWTSRCSRLWSNGSAGDWTLRRCNAPSVAQLRGNRLCGWSRSVRRRLLLSSSQYKLFWVWGQALGHPKDTWTAAQMRLCLGTEPGKALSVQEEIGIPAVRVNQCIKVNLEALDPCSSGGQREIERIVGRRQCRQLRHERREQQIIQHLDLDLEA